MRACSVVLKDVGSSELDLKLRTSLLFRIAVRVREWFEAR